MALAAFEATGDDDVGDDLLQPRSSRPATRSCRREARVALTLRLLGGLTTDEIARAFLVPETTIAQRIVRAKRTLSEAHVPFEVPRADELASRLASVLEVVYLIFNEGYSATAGDDWMRPGLCDEALRLGRMLAELEPAEPEVHGLVALMEIQASRSGARTDPAGEPILLLDQDRAPLGPAPDPAGPGGPGASRTARRRPRARMRSRPPSRPATRGHATPEATDWVRIAALYDALAAGGALADRRAEPGGRGRDGLRSGGRAGGRSTRSSDDPALKGYHLLPAVRGDLLAKLGRDEEAAAEFRRAAGLTRNERERRLLLERAGDAALG